MEGRSTKKFLASLLIGSAGVLGLLAAGPAAAQTLPTATPPYKISVFAQSPDPTNIKQPDSIVSWRDRVIVGFANGAAKDGTKVFSTILDFSFDGNPNLPLPLQGHTDVSRV